jgi:tRNA wybutosine-synthesizing protein 3
MAASLHHAQHVLSAAIGAGFRESGVQSLKNLDDPNALPMVAVRTAGLAFSTVIGYMSGSSQVGLVEEEQLKLLLKVANERFVANADRIARFRERLLHSRSSHPPGWEEESTRRERKRAEGLKMRDQQRLQRASRENVVAETDLIRNSSVENLEMFA